MPFKDALREKEYQRQYRQIHKVELTENNRQYQQYRKAGGEKLGHHRKASDVELLESYNRLGSVWLVADELGMAGQNVWAHLNKLGIKDKDKWTDEQLQILRVAYNIKDTETLNINELAKHLGKDKTNVCRKAKELGLSTNRFRKRSNEMNELMGERMKTWIHVNGHPTGYRELRMCLACGKMMELQHSAKNKTCSRSCAATLRMRSEHIFSRCNSGRRIDLNNQFFRSAYEANYARYLNYVTANSLFNIVSWQYEPDTFKFSKVSDSPKQYTPDFKVFYGNYHCAYHEVKGWDYPKGIKARERFNKYYPNLELILIGEDFFANAVNNGLSKLIPNWEYYKCQNNKKEIVNETI